MPFPGVTAVSAAMVPALGGSSWGTNVEVEGFESGPDIDSNSRYKRGRTRILRDARDSPVGRPGVRRWRRCGSARSRDRERGVHPQVRIAWT